MQTYSSQDTESVFNKKILIYFLSKIRELGSVSVRRISRIINSYDDIIYMKKEELCDSFQLTEKQAESLLSATVRDCTDKLRNELAEMEKQGVFFITCYDNDFPEKLERIHQPPAFLFYKGELPTNSPCVSIIGSRAATNYGISMTEYFSETLAEKGISIISGMASGIDGAAHRGALRTDEGKTYAILGGGVNICYPKENYPIYDKIFSDKRGGIISELPPGCSPLKCNFPLRNRIISGLSDVVIVMEAREKSGSLITADYALDQNKDVMALPGRITDPLSRGCNNLISSGAAMLKCPDDVLELLDLKLNGRIDIPCKNIKLLAKKEKVVYSTLDFQPKYTQQIVDETGFSFSEVVSILLNLEINGYITQYSAGYYGIL